MTRAIITVTEYSSMPGRFVVKSSTSIDRRGVPFERDVTGAAAAAGVALELAIDARSGYAVFGPQSVLDQIPADMRSRNE